MLLGRPNDAKPAPVVIQSSRPWVAGDYQWGYQPLEEIAPYFEKFGLSYDPTQAYYWVQPFDCRAEPAKGVTVELQVFDETALKPCDSCTVAYSDDQGFPEPSFTDFSSLGQLAYVIGPARQSVVVMRDVKTRRAVAALTLVTLPGYIHQLSRCPPSIAQLADFPPGAL